MTDQLNPEDAALFIPAFKAWQQAGKRLEEAQREFVAKQGALAYLNEHMRAKYELADGDDINDQGLIIYKEQPDA